MAMKQMDEEKRSKIVKVAMLVTSIVIILVLAFFIMASIVRNPLEGEWYSETNDYYLDIDENEVTLEGTFDGVYAEIELQYTIDKEAKTVTIKPTASSYAEAAKDTEGKITAAELDQLLASFVTSYDYSLEQNTLILKEREFGDKYEFTRIDK